VSKGLLPFILHSGLGTLHHTAAETGTLEIPYLLHVLVKVALRLLHLGLKLLQAKGRWGCLSETRPCQQVCSEALIPSPSSLA
jgi:hypothetical protein